MPQYFISRLYYTFFAWKRKHALDVEKNEEKNAW